MRMHDDDLAVRDDVVRRLVARELPERAGASLRRLRAAGSSNVLYRLGDDLLVRLPRQPGGSVAIEKEARWLPVLSSVLPVRVPDVVLVGAPGFGYPERWSIVGWIDGEHPATPVAAGSAQFARDLAAVVARLRAAEVPPSAHADPALHRYRADPIGAIDGEIRRYLAACGTIADLPLDVDGALRFWDRAVALPDPPADDAARWVHADLLAENLLVAEGRLTAVLDFGAVALGRPGVDLVAAWETLGPADREVFRSAVGVDEAEWLRGRAWAFAIAVMTLPYYWHSLPGRCAQRLVMAHAVLDDFAVHG